MYQVSLKKWPGNIGDKKIGGKLPRNTLMGNSESNKTQAKAQLFSPLWVCRQSKVESSDISPVSPGLLVAICAYQHVQ